MGLWGLSLSSQKDHDLSPLPHECSYHLLSCLDLACVSSKKMLSLHQKVAADEILAVGMIKKILRKDCKLRSCKYVHLILQGKTILWQSLIVKYNSKKGLMS